MSNLNLRAGLALATLSIASVAQAEVVFVDDFSVGSVSVSQLAPGTNSASVSDAPIVGVNRTLSIEVISQGADSANMSVTSGLFTLAAANTGTFGVAEYGIGYSGAAFAGLTAGTNGSISFDLVSLDQIPLDLELLISTFTGTVVSTLQINSLVLPTTYTISGIADFSQGFTLRFSGKPAYDFSIDNLTFQIPEPTSLALAGLALIGLGAARRRRTSGN